MKTRQILSRLLILLMTFGLASCLGNDEPSGTTTASDFAVLTGYTTGGANFQVETSTGGLVTLYTTDSSILDPEKYPVGSRVFLNYLMNYPVDINLPVKISLSSVFPVSTVIPDDAPASDCKPDYKAFAITSIYPIGDYLNIAASIERAENRTWKCLLNTQTSTDDIAELYLITEADKTESIGTTAAISINIQSLRRTKKEIRLHINNHQSSDYVYTFKTSEI